MDISKERNLTTSEASASPSIQHTAWIIIRTDFATLTKIAQDLEALQKQQRIKFLRFEVGNQKLRIVRLGGDEQ